MISLNFVGLLQWCLLEASQTLRDLWLTSQLRRSPQTTAVQRGAEVFATAMALAFAAPDTCTIAHGQRCPRSAEKPHQDYVEI